LLNADCQGLSDLLNKHLKLASEPSALIDRVNKVIDSFQKDELSLEEKTWLKGAVTAFVKSSNKELSRRYIRLIQDKKWEELKIMVGSSYGSPIVNL